jgi:hypothetical protein
VTLDGANEWILHRNLAAGERVEDFPAGPHAQREHREPAKRPPVSLQHELRHERSGMAGEDPPERIAALIGEP